MSGAGRKVTTGLLLAVVLCGCGPFGEGETGAIPSPTPQESPTALGTGEDLTLGFDDVSPGGMVGETENLGTAEVSVEWLSSSGADAVLEARTDGGQAVRFPPLSASPAVVTVTSTDGEDVLSPKDAGFRFGADVNLDPDAVGEASRTTRDDNGNNVVQRGRFADAAQYKIQVDKGRASCRLQGDKGEVLVKADEPVLPGVWTRLECTRRGDRVTLSQEVLEGPGAGERQSWEVKGRVGSIKLSRGASPMTVGGKINERGEPARSDSDQFNGAIDNVVYDRTS